MGWLSKIRLIKKYCLTCMLCGQNGLDLYDLFLGFEIRCSNSILLTHLMRASFYCSYSIFHSEVTHHREIDANTSNGVAPFVLYSSKIAVKRAYTYSSIPVLNYFTAYIFGGTRM
jgi:hypothetical protein